MDNIIVSTFFWQMLFEENQIASKLISISTEPDGVIFNVGQFGEVTFKCYPASKPGDNFMSETFIGTATISDGTSFRTFIKVNINTTYTLRIYWVFEENDYSYFAYYWLMKWKLRRRNFWSAAVRVIGGLRTTSLP